MELSQGLDLVVVGIECIQESANNHSPVYFVQGTSRRKVSPSLLDEGSVHSAKFQKICTFTRGVLMEALGFWYVYG